MLFVLVYAILLFVQPIQMNMRAGKCLSPWWLYVPQSLLGILAINGIARKWLNRPNLFSRIGRDSMVYYCLHWIIILAVSIFFPARTECDFAFFFATVVANMVGLPLLNYAIKHSRWKGIVCKHSANPVLEIIR
jgi:fucose 4-O-acetylase-like acetyltransferase